MKGYSADPDIRRAFARDASGLELVPEGVARPTTVDEVRDILREATATGRTLVVDETRRTGGVGEGVVAELVAAGYAGRIARVASKDSFVPLGDAARLVLLSEDEIEDAAMRLLE